MGTKAHKKDPVRDVRIGIITLSSTRNLSEDESGNWIAEEAEKQGHCIVCRKLIPDDPEILEQTVPDMINEHRPRILILTGGTGIAAKDETVETLLPFFDKELTAFGSIFAQLSYNEIGSAAVLSRATAGIVDGVAVFCLPGSLNACKLACESLIFPEVGHIVKHLND